MADTGSAILIAFIITIAFIGVAGGVTLAIVICIKWRECVKRRNIMPTAAAASRQPTRRNRRIRVQNTHNSRGNSDDVIMDLPPPYSEIEDQPPPYSLGHFNLNLGRQGSSRGHTRGSSGQVTPLGRTRGNSITRNSMFSVHINTGSTNTPMVTPAGSMFASSVVNSRGVSATSNGRQQTNTEDGVT